MLAIIPARGGSKGLPGKNLKVLNGFPLIYHTIRAAIDSLEVSRVIVSTEDKRIAEIAREYGAEVPFLRPTELAQDDSMVMDSYFFTIQELNSTEGIEVREFVALLPTVPLRTAEDITKSVMLFRGSRADSVISVTDAPVPIDWYMKIDQEGRLSKCVKDSDPVRNRQKCQQNYIPNGAIYVFNYHFLKKHREYYSENTYHYYMKKERSVDEEIDFKLAEILFSNS